MGGPRRVAGGARGRDRAGFVEFGSTKLVLARRRRKLIAEHGRGKVHTLRLAIPFKEKRNANGAATRKKATTTSGDLFSNGKPLARFPLTWPAKPHGT